MQEIENICEEIYCIKNIVSVEYQNNLIQYVKGQNSFPWYTIDKIGHNQYFDGKESPYLDPNVSDFGGLYHLLYDEGIPRSDDLRIFLPILENYCKFFKKEISEIYRIRMRYTHPVPNHNNSKYAAPHVDFEGDEDFTTLIYYLDHSDGDTILFSKFHKPGIENYNPIINEKLQEVYRHTPTRGEAIVFNGHRYHSGNYPINYGKRIVINFDFLEHEKK